jgi:hypothetical protein
MTAVVRPKHLYDAETVLDRLLTTEVRAYCIEHLAKALAEAEEYGVRKALHRLGPAIADAEVARAELADEVDL